MTCPACLGSGLGARSIEADGYRVPDLFARCEACGGAGTIPERRCRCCGRSDSPALGLVWIEANLCAECRIERAA